MNFIINDDARPSSYDAIKQLLFDIYLAEDQPIDENIGGKELCERFMKGSNMVDQNRENMERGFSVAIVMLSIFSLLTIILTINSEEKLKAHPAKLIRLICLIEAIFGWQALIRSPQVSAGYFNCYFNNNNIFLIMTFRGGDDDLHDQRLGNSLKVLVWSNEIIYMYFQFASLVSNMCLCHDLIKTLQSPFDSANKRMRNYQAIIFLSPFFIMIVILNLAD